jgi:hypothetical protein
MLWVTAFAGPVAWTAHNLLSAAVVSAVCASPQLFFVLHVLTAGTLLLAGSGAWIAGRRFAIAGGSGERFVAGGSSLLNVLFALVIVAEGLPNFVLDPCWS